VEELILSVEFLRSKQKVVARVASEAGGVREYSGLLPLEVIELVIDDLREEFESTAPPS
jgi:hypothetical protein